MPHISELDDLVFWSSLHFGQQIIGHLGSWEVMTFFFLVFATFWAKKWVIWEVMTFFVFLVFTSLNFNVLGKNLGIRAGVSNLQNHTPNLEKWSILQNHPPMLNIDLHPW